MALKISSSGNTKILISLKISKAEPTKKKIDRKIFPHNKLLRRYDKKLSMTVCFYKFDIVLLFAVVITYEIKMSD